MTFKPGLKGLGVSQIEQGREGHSGEGNNNEYTVKFIEIIRKTKNANHCKECSKERAPLRKQAKFQRKYYLLHRNDFMHSVRLTSHLL